MDRVARARIAAGLAAAGGAALAWLGLWGAGAGLLAIGAMVALLVTEHDVPAGLADATAAGATASAARIARGLRLDGHGIVIPGKGESPSRLFIPARHARLDELPPLTADTIFQREGPGALGVQLPPPGAALEARWRQEHGLPEGRGAEEAAAHIRAALPSLALGRGVFVGRGRDTVRVAYEPLELAEACRATRELHAPWHLQGGCPACSFVAILVARAHGSPVRILDAGADGPRAFLDLEVGPRSRV